MTFSTPSELMVYPIPRVETNPEITATQLKFSIYIGVGQIPRDGRRRRRAGTNMIATDCISQLNTQCNHF